MPSIPQIAIAPLAESGRRPRSLVAAVEAGGGRVVDLEEAEAVVWIDPEDPDSLGKLLSTRPDLRWVQLPWAGVEPYAEVIGGHPDVVWSCAKGIYAEPVAEHALALALAGRRALDRFAREHGWSGQQGRNLLGARVTVVGGGGIAASFLRMLAPFGCDVTVVRTTPRPTEGADRVVGADGLDDALAGADLAVLALPLLPDTRGLIDRRRLDLLAPGGGLVNVARGAHVVTGDLVGALDDGPLGSAGLDVTDPEPLPDGHPLWGRPDVIVTPHTANTQEMAAPLLSRRVTGNVQRYAAGEPLEGRVDPARGY